MRRDGEKAQRPSIDRIDNGIGYEPQNVAVICYRCNARKGNLNSAELFRLATWLRGAEAQVEFSLVGS